MFNEFARDIAKLHGATLRLEPIFGYSGVIEVSGRYCFPFKGTVVPINDHAAASIANDKFQCSGFLQRAGLRTPEEQMLSSDELICDMAQKNPRFVPKMISADDAQDFIDTHGYPLFLKPNEGSEGKGVVIVHSDAEFRKQVTDLFRKYPRVVMQKPIVGREFRCVSYKNKVWFMYEKAAPEIEGDGVHTAEELIEEMNSSLNNKGRRSVLRIDDPRLLECLRAAELSLNDVLERGQKVVILPVANISSSGLIFDHSHSIPPSIENICLAANNALGLKFSGIDIFVSEGDEEPTVLEVNPSPGLHGYASISSNSRASVRELYERIFLDYVDGEHVI